MTTTPANDSAAAVIAALDPDRTRTHKQVVIEARTAFAAILDRLERVEAENTRLRFLESFVRTIKNTDNDFIEGYGADGLVYEWQRQAAALLAADESEAKP